jgi:hypothetical protein
MKTTYAQGTELVTPDHPMACGFRSGKALCPDGKVRAVLFRNGGIADTFFSVPAAVRYKGKTVAGYVTIQTVEGYSVPSDDDPAVVKFFPYLYRKNGKLFEQ